MKTGISFRFHKAVILTLLILSAISFKQSLATGFSYKWGHPSPQGNNVYGIAFKDAATGWAVTGCGSILETSDGGESWSLQAQPDSLCNDLYDIVLSSQGTLIASGDKGMIKRSDDDGASWETFTFPGAGRLYDLALIPGGGISAAGENGVVLVSFDDGLSWTDVGPGGSGYAKSHFWKSASEGYVVGQDMFYRTVDGGVTWTQVATPSFFGMNEVYFVNDNVGYATEDFGDWKTVDGGDTWIHEEIFSGLLYRFRTVVIDELHWYAVTFIEGGEIWETTDAGANWTMKWDYYSNGFLCLVRNGDRLLFGSDIGDIFYTDDGGTTVDNAVQNLAVFPSAPVTIIGMRPDGTLFANNQPNSGVDNGTFFRSDDGGESWYVPMQSPGLRWVSDIRFSDNQHGVLGSYSDIRYTSDGGETWNVSSLPANFSLVNFALPSQDAYFAGTYSTSPPGGGNVFKSTDQGATWELVNGGLPVNSLYVSCISFANASTGYVACLINNLPDIYKTVNDGQTWSLINQTGIPSYLSDMIWLDENTGIAAVPNSESGLFRTTDGGKNWTRVSETGARQLTSYTNNFIAAVDPGDMILQESTDGGLSWLPYSPPFSSGNAGSHGTVQSIQGTENGYVLGGTGNRLMVAERDTETGTAELKDNEQAGQEIIIIPNPVNNNAVIRFHLASGNHVNLSLYDTQGRFVRTFIDKNLQAGTYEVPVNAGELRNNMVSGVYFVELQTHESFQSAKLILAE